MDEISGYQESTADPLRAGCFILLASLYVPTFYRLFSYGWRQSDYTHGPLILLVFLWIIWQKRALFTLPADNGRQPWFVATLLFGLVLYVFGVICGVMMFEAGSLIPVLLGATGYLYGRAALLLLLFPAAFLIFLVPPPLFFIDFVTSPLKLLVAKATAPLLAIFGYPISRDGVILYIGDYSIIVGDACSGLRSLVSLMSVGALYAYMQKISKVKKGIIFLSIIPISVAGNILRLIILCLITYHFGDAAGQGFFHNFSGFFLFIVALGCLVIVDVILDRGKKSDAPSQG
jgi:exosortase